MPRGTRCQAHRHDAIVSEEHHHVQPLSRGGKTTPANMTWLCANAHSDVHAYLDLLEQGHGHVAWNVARTFGPGVREYACRGWEAYREDFLAGKYDRHAALWFSSGAARTPSVPPYSHAVATRTVARWLLHASDLLKGPARADVHMSPDHS